MHETTSNTEVVPVETDGAQGVAQASSKPSLMKVVWASIGVLPTLLILAALGGVGYWGHHTGWRMPNFSELKGGAQPASDDWCLVHNLPESACVECTPTLLPNEMDFGWCKRHGVHQCPLCNPSVAQVKQTPRISDQHLQTVSLALAIRNRQENNMGCTLYRNRVQFASIDSVKKAGVDVELVETGPITESVAANGEITYDETRVAHLASRVPGTIWRVDKTVGDRVQRGDVLALIDAAEVGKAKAALLDALAQIGFHTKTVARLKPLYRKQVVTSSRMLEAETALQQADIRLRQSEQALLNLGLAVSVEDLASLSETERRERIRFLGLPDEMRRSLASDTGTNNLIPLIASLDGVVTQREAVEGEVVDPTSTLFQLADISRMWLTFNVSLEDAGHLTVGQPVRFEPDGTRVKVTGHLSWISTDVDRHTRTVAVRAEVDNPDGKLRNETFGVGHIILREVAEAVIVPSEAVQWDGSCFVAFVRDRNYFEEGHPKIFHTRTVRPGVEQEGVTEILAGLIPGEVVVTEGSSVLRSQILKNELGAGCTCGH